MALALLQQLMRQRMNFISYLYLEEAGQLKDVLIDTAGGAIGLALLALILYLKNRYKAKEKQ